MNAADKNAFDEYKADMQAEADQAEFELAEDRRREWAQFNGNDSGYDPYAYL